MFKFYWHYLFRFNILRHIFTNYIGSWMILSSILYAAIYPVCIAVSNDAVKYGDFPCKLLPKIIWFDKNNGKVPYLVICVALENQYI